MLFFVGDEPRWFGQKRDTPREQITRKRPPWGRHHTAFGPIKHEGIMHKSDARLHVLQRMAGKGTPRANRHQKPQTCPRIDGDGAIMQIGNDGLEFLFPDFSDGARMD